MYLFNNLNNQITLSEKYSLYLYKINLIITKSFPKKMFTFYKGTPVDKLKVLKDMNSEIIAVQKSLLESLSKFQSIEIL